MEHSFTGALTYAKLVSMTDLKTLVTEIFTDGEFISFNQIRTGDTIIRGGAYIGDNTPMLGAVHIGKVVVIKRNPYDEDNLTCYTDERPLGAAIAVESLTNAWYYRIPVTVDEYERPDTNSHLWVNALIEKYIQPKKYDRINYEDINSGDILFTADSTEGTIEGDNFVPDAYIGIANEEDEWGWGIPPTEDGERIGFSLVGKSDIFEDYIYKIS